MASPPLAAGLVGRVLVSALVLVHLTVGVQVSKTVRQCAGIGKQYTQQ